MWLYWDISKSSQVGNSIISIQERQKKLCLTWECTSWATEYVGIGNFHLLCCPHSNSRDSHLHLRFKGQQGTKKKNEF